MCAVHGAFRSSDRGLPAVEPGHHHVERDDVRVDRLHLVEAVLAVDRSRHVEPLKGKIHGDKLPDHLVVVHDEHPSQTLRHAGEATASGDAMGTHGGMSHRSWEAGNLSTSPGPHSSGDRAPPSGAGCVGSNPTGGATAGALHKPSPLQADAAGMPDAGVAVITSCLVRETTSIVSPVQGDAAPGDVTRGRSGFRAGALRTACGMSHRPAVQVDCRDGEVVEQDGVWPGARFPRQLAPLMEAALRWLAGATPAAAGLLRLMDATPVPCGTSAVTARRSDPYGHAGVWVLPEPFPLVLGQQAAADLHLRRDRDQGSAWRTRNCTANGTRHGRPWNASRRTARARHRRRYGQGPVRAGNWGVLRRPGPGPDGRGWARPLPRPCRCVSRHRRQQMGPYRPRGVRLPARTCNGNGSAGMPQEQP